jgi:hypothetical protein
MSTEKKSLVEDALLQMKNLQQVVTENSKGILSSIMKGEIEELVKESLEDGTENEMMEDEMSPEMEEGTHMSMDEQEEEDSLEIDMSDDEMELPMSDMGDEMSDEDMMDDEDELSPLDLTQASDDEILKVVMGMGDEDRLIIQKNGNNADVDMLTQTDSMSFPIDGDDELDMDDESYDEVEFEDGDEEIVYEIEMEDEDDMFMSIDDEHGWYDKNDRQYKGGFDFDYDEEDIDSYDDLVSKYGDKQRWFKPESDSDKNLFNAYKDKYQKPFKVRKRKPMSENEMNESMTVKPKGLTGNGPKKVVFKGENIHKGPKGKISSDAKKFVKGEFKEGYGMNKGDESKTHKGDKDYTTKKGDTLKRKAFEEEETTEASRTFGNGSRNYPKRGLPKMKVVTNSALKEEVETLRTKNDEYRKALNIFREKLNEVAVFNSNLAYATKLFTEHSTTKQEKINIMRRFDNVETIKESKNLYTQIKGELDGKKTTVVKESIVENIDRTPSKGSTNLIESKTYENPQFLRMKDLMSKIK